MLGRVQPLPEGLRDRPFSVAEARAEGIHVERLRRHDLRSDFAGVRTPNHLADDFEARCRAYATRLGEGRFFSHLSAARIWRMRLPTWTATEPIHVTAVQPVRAPRVRGVRGHHVEEPGPGVTHLRGFVVTTPEETWRMLCETLTLEQLVIAGDGLLARHDPLSTLPMLRRIVELSGGRRGAARLRAAFDLMRPLTDSARETSLRLLLRKARLPEPEVNGLLTGPGAGPRYGDLVFRRWRVVVEYEGIHHQQSRETYLSDIQRFAELSDRWTFVRVTKEHAPHQVVALVEAALSRADELP